MLRAYKYRLWTNTSQERELGIMLETHRRLYNACLEQRKTAYAISLQACRLKSYMLFAITSPSFNATNPATTLKTTFRPAKSHSPSLRSAPVSYSKVENVV